MGKLDLNPNCSLTGRFIGQHRLIDPETGNYLHETGQGPATGTDHAWLGSLKQAEGMQREAERENRAFPYQAIKINNSNTRRKYNGINAF